MKITDVKTATFYGIGPAVFVRIYTDEGVTGLGECYPSREGIAQIVLAMKNLLVGENPLNVDRLYEKVRKTYIFGGALAGSVITALSGIEIALWDLAGKAIGVPVYQLMGGKFRDRIRIYADCHAGEGDTPESNARKAKEVVAMGYNAIKFDIDDANNPYKLDQWNWSVTPGEVEVMVEKVAAIREAIGPHIDLAIDMHGRYDTHSAIRVAQALEPYNLMWLEEPVPPENVDAMLEVKHSARVTICAGENLYTRFGYRDLLEKQAVGIIMPDLPKVGGLSEGRKIANMAELYYIPLAPHNVSSPVGTIAACHTCASIPNFLVLEFHGLNIKHWNDLIITDHPVIQEGYITLPDKPGLGVELNEEVAKEHLHKNAEFFE